jgi:hypothetical protein
VTGFSDQADEWPGRGDWLSITTAISRGLHDVRTDWFDLCVKAAREALPGGRKDTSKPAVVNEVLAGQAELMVKAYQMYLASLFLGRHRYISPSDDADFTDLLYAQMGGVDVEQCASLARAYEFEDDQFLWFAGHLLGYITGGASLPAVSVVIACRTPIFVALTNIVVARSFRDTRTADRLHSELQRMAKEADTRMLEALDVLKEELGGTVRD